LVVAAFFAARTPTLDLTLNQVHSDQQQRERRVKARRHPRGLNFRAKTGCGAVDSSRIVAKRASTPPLRSPQRGWPASDATGTCAPKGGQIRNTRSCRYQEAPELSAGRFFSSDWRARSDSKSRPSPRPYPPSRNVPLPAEDERRRGLSKQLAALCGWLFRL